jgi:hypothetical protein
MRQPTPPSRVIDAILPNGVPLKSRVVCYGAVKEGMSKSACLSVTTPLFNFGPIDNQPQLPFHLLQTTALGPKWHTEVVVGPDAKRMVIQLPLADQSPTGRHSSIESGRQKIANWIAFSCSTSRWNREQQHHPTGGADQVRWRDSAAACHQHPASDPEPSHLFRLCRAECKP